MTRRTGVEVIADSDSRWKWGALLAGRLGAEVVPHCNLVDGRAVPNDRQLAEIGVPAATVRRMSLPALLRDNRIATSDVVILAVAGGAVQTALHGLRAAWAEPVRRPVVITGYVGVVYERQVDGLLLRAGADIVLANSPSDAERFRRVFAELGLDPEVVVEGALPFLGGAPYDPAAVGRQRLFTVCFATQPSAPKDKAGRLYLLERAAAHARRHPDRTVVVKLRSRPNEQTTHIEDHHFERLASLLPSLPPNLEFAYGSMDEMLDRTDLLVTVSSTAALEAMHRGIPTAILTDLGVREALGNHYFVGSGCLASWDRLDDGHVPQSDHDWMRSYGVEAGPDPYGPLRTRVGDLIETGLLPPLRPYYSVDNAAGYLPGLLERNGLAATGMPLRPSANNSVLRRQIRRGMKRSARTVYRVGVRNVAPVIRRWSEL